VGRRGLLAVGVKELGLATRWHVQPGVGVLAAVPADIEAFSGESGEVES